MASLTLINVAGSFNSNVSTSNSVPETVMNAAVWARAHHRWWLAH